MEFQNIRIILFTKGFGKMDIFKEKENLHGLTDLHTKENTLEEKSMEQENLSTVLKKYIKENGKMASNKEKESYLVHKEKC